MTHVEQKKIISELREYERKMGRYEQEDFHMFVKRDKDDEDLDDNSKKKLLQQYEKYVMNKPKKTVKSPFGDIVERG